MWIGDCKGNTFVEGSKKERDKYLPENTEVWVGATQDIYDEVMDLYDDIMSKQDAMASKLADYGSLMDDEGNLTNIKDQIKALDDYGKALTDLQTKGIGESLLSEISSMDVDDALAYTEELLKKGPKALEQYNAEWEEKQKKAKDIADKFYKDKRDEIENSFLIPLRTEIGLLESDSYSAGKQIAENVTSGILGKEPPQAEEKPERGESAELKKALEKWEKDQVVIQEKIKNYMLILTDEMSVLEENAYKIGGLSMEELARGIDDGRSEVVNAMIRAVRAAIAAARAELDINSPSGEFEEIGDYSVDGYIAPWKNRISDVEASIRDTLKAGANIARQQVTNTNSQSIDYGDTIFQFGQLVNDSDRDIHDVMRVSEFYRRQNIIEKGGRL